MKKKNLRLIALLTALLLVGCDSVGGNTTDPSGSSVGTSNPSGEAETADPVIIEDAASPDEMFTDRDKQSEYDESDAIIIELDGKSAKASDSSVKISGSTVTLTKDATHIITGELDGMIIVDAPDTAKMQLVLNNVSITSESSAAIYIKEADKVFITLVGENTLASGDSFEAIDENNIDATLFSKQDMTLNGAGVLNVSSPSGHGIVSKDDLVLTGGSYNIVSASHAIDANDSVRIINSSVTADAGKDGIRADNSDNGSKGFVYIESGSFTIESEGDGISSSAYMQIVDGEFDIVAGGGSVNGTKESSSSWGGFGGFGGGRPMGGRMESSSSGNISLSSGSVFLASSTSSDSTSMKGIKSGGDLMISGGSFKLDTADDSIHSNKSAAINGGEFTIASGDDAIHAEDTLVVTAGKISISESYEGLEAIHIDVRGGEIDLVSSDDGFNAAGGTDSSGTGGGRDGMFGGGGFGGSSNSNGSINISGGIIKIKASGDGIDANGTLEISGGSVTLTGPTQGDTAVLDFDKSATITGGRFIGTGSSMMAQSFSSATQGVIAISVGSQSAGTQIVIKDSNGNTVITHTPTLSYQIVIISIPELVSGATYSVSVGSQSGEITAN